MSLLDKILGDGKKDVGAVIAKDCRQCAHSGFWV